MKKKPVILVGTGIALVLIVFFVVMHRDARIEALIGPMGRRLPMMEYAYEPEVVQAELADHGKALIPGLRVELRRGEWRQKSWMQPLNRIPVLGEYLSKPDYGPQFERRKRAALCLGRLGPAAHEAIPELEFLAAHAGSTLGPVANIALVMIQQDNSALQSNAVAALTSSNQIHRFEFAMYGHEIWPDKPELLLECLADPNADVRSLALMSLGKYGLRASNAAPAVKELLHDPYVRVRPQAALTLGQISPENAELAVSVMLDQQRTNKNRMGDEAYVLYQAVGPAARAAVPSLEAELKVERDKIFHGDVAAALWRITGKTTPEMIEALGENVRIGTQRSQLRSLRAIKEIGPPAMAAMPPLQKMTNHPLIMMRQAAVEAMNSISLPTPAKP